MLYNYPEYYEIAFSFRDIPREVAFIKTCIDKFSDIEVRNVFEIGCGNAPHTGELIKIGYNYIGLDNNKNMLDYANKKYRDIHPSPLFHEADMGQFDYNQKVDFTFVMLGSLYLNSNAELNSHFDSIAKILKPGGLYFLDWCIQFTDPLLYKDNNKYSIEDKGIIIESEFKISLSDSVNHMYKENWTINVNDHGNHRTFNIIEHNKALFPKDFLKFLRARKDFEFIGWWRDWDLDKPITDHTDIIRPIALVKRIG